ncbi:endonuclease/exonuclease/phosphatase family protein [uncultured Microscilla sp.]|uniref:endonuclease/exonuclease/phosphatase family protein n=1 Tax=uncultured Microscilla sp. TaxID=432653 RepID=UPI002601888E|nr:endonuclease/exonuclease/phosphatase family protein [uncultured Microscilla sp.]
MCYKTGKNARYKEWLCYLFPLFLCWILIYPPDFFAFLSLQALALQIVVGWGLTIVLFSFFGKTRYIPTHLLGVLGVVWFLQPYVQTQSQKPVKLADTFKVLHLNVHGRNAQHTQLVEQLLRQEADLLALIEVNHRWAKVLKKGLHKQYPYAFVYPVDNLFSGIAIFAKYPLKNVQYIFNDEPPTVAGDVLLPQGKVHFISTHISAPILQGRIPRRYSQMDKIAQQIKQHREKPLVLLGDFNAVPWERLIRDFKQTTHLQGTHTSWLPTFPTWALWMGIPIDYIFYSPQLYCQKLNTFKYTGSDHVGLVGEFGLK